MKELFYFFAFLCANIFIFLMNGCTDINIGEEKKIYQWFLLQERQSKAEVLNGKN